MKRKFKSIKSDIELQIFEGRIYDLDFYAEKSDLYYINKHFIKGNQFRELFVEVNPEHPYKMIKKQNNFLFWIILCSYFSISFIAILLAYFFLFKR